MTLLGEPNVGKSAFNRYCSSRFDTNLEQLHEQVYGVSFAVKILKNINIEMTLVVWNFTGQDRYKSVQPHYMTGVSGVLLLFDLTRLETFNKLPDWIEFIKKYDATVPTFLVGTKADLFDQKDITDTGIENFVNSNGLHGYYEVSFKTGLNVESVIEKMAELMYQHRILKQPPPTGFQLQRKHPNRPIILDEENVRAKYLLTVRTIFDMTFSEFDGRIKQLDKHLKEVQQEQNKLKLEWIQNEIERISQELVTQHKIIENIIADPPVSLPTYLRLDLSKEWKRKLDKLRYHMFVFKDVCQSMVCA
jgi:small GTP-binding protein